MYDVTVIGPAVIDILASPVDIEMVRSGSRDINEIRMSFGGDALNEAVVLSRMGKKVQLISKVGDDEAGKRVLEYIGENGIATDSILVQPGLDTAINIALVDPEGNRIFLMDPKSSLRRLSPEDVLPQVDAMAGIVSFASMFISPLFTVPAMEELFVRIKESGRRLAVDMTRPKNRETIETIRPLLPYIDVFAPNDAEIAALTGSTDAAENVRMLVEAGVDTAVVKVGAEGCLVGCCASDAAAASDAPGSAAARAGSQTAAGQTRSGSAAARAGSQTAAGQMGSGSAAAEAGSQTAAGRTGTGRPDCAGSGRTLIERVPAVTGVRCVDTTGAGDTFAAGFIAGMCEGRSRTDCARLGCAAASCTIEKIGATEGLRDLPQVMARYARIGTAVRIG